MARLVKFEKSESFNYVSIDLEALTKTLREFLQKYFLPESSEPTFRKLNKNLTISLPDGKKIEVDTFTDFLAEIKKLDYDRADLHFMDYVDSGGRSLFIVLTPNQKSLSVSIMFDKEEAWPELREKLINKLGLEESKEVYTTEKVIPAERKFTEKEAFENLSFIDDEQLKNLLARDLVYAHECFENLQWKLVVILCGGIVESSLYFKLSPFSKTAIESLFKAAYPERQPKSLEKMTFNQIISISQEAGIIGKDAGFADAIRNYRNYVHPIKELEAQKEGHKIAEELADLALRFTKHFLDKIK